MGMRSFVWGLCVALILVGCSKAPQEVIELKRFPIDSVEGIITQSGIWFDKQVSSDGNGSLKIMATEPTVVRLFELGDIDIENARLIYQAKCGQKG
jgi:hypothetical protein